MPSAAGPEMTDGPSRDTTKIEDGHNESHNRPSVMASKSGVPYCKYRDKRACCFLLNFASLTLIIGDSIVALTWADTARQV